MAQHDMNIANQGFPATRADINNALQALASNSSGTSAPSTMFANQWWYDTTNNKLYIRNEANNAWIQVAVLDQTNNEWQITTGQISASDGDGLVFKTDDGNTRITLSDGGDVTFADGTDIITASAGTDNVRLGQGAGDSIVSGATNNVVIGKDAGTAISTGDNNTFVGHQSGLANTTGVNNVAIGKGALDANTTGVQNTAIGTDALTSNTTANDGTAVGFETLLSNTTGGQNTAVGRKAMYTNSTGDNNSAVGFNAMFYNTSGADNAALGVNALQANTTGNFNSAVGRKALTSNTDGAQNTAVGYEALSSNVSAAQNTALGYGALASNTSGGPNTAVGRGSLNSNVTGNENVAVGINALNSSTGNQNTAVGAYCLDGTDDGIQNTAVGALALGSNCDNGNTAVGNESLKVCTGFHNTAIGLNSGKAVTSGGNLMLLGKDAGLTGSPGGNHTTGSNSVVIGDEQIANIYAQVSVTATSDERDKTDFTPLNLGLDFVNDLSPVTYKWDRRINYADKTETDWRETVDLDKLTNDGTHKDDDLQVGFKAQEVIALEEAAGYRLSDETNLTATQTHDGKQFGLRYERFVPILVKAVQELSAKNDALEARIATLEG